jgi:tetratricopeptide (TPR) repeat protein
MRAQAYMAMGNNTKAQEEFIAITGTDPDNLNARLGLAMTYKNGGLFEKASLLIGLLIEEEPGNAALYIARSDIEREQGHYELALMDVEKAIGLDPGNAEYYTLQSILLEKCGKKSAAANSRRLADKLRNQVQKR